ncbi:MAG: tRNA(5-methylaminomethyl-2-thiouridylate) methyltransferase, partial [Deltaproteobacteria bacterium]|nr:tRNA(5-methylaminomethyl-2-thiouridylate) methyltransferase [Deltaproteobacteria bacterium]
MNSYDAVALFSGGLDGILAVRLIEEQGLKVKCLHFTSPFCGDARKIPYWRDRFGLDMDAVDIGDGMVGLLAHGPAHGFGKTLNPCMDCKILMLREAKARMTDYGARCIITGEVLGQRPMSQRRDALHVILRDAGVKDVLVRPLSAKLLPESAVEASGLIDREKLCGVWGRGRKEQLALAERFALPEIPPSAGGCKLTERENARRYWPVLVHAPNPSATEFRLANSGRQFWSNAGQGPHWLCVGRDKSDNDSLARNAFPGDALFSLVDFPGPLAVGRQYQPWPEHVLRDAAALMASAAPRAARLQGTVRVRADLEQGALEMDVRPARETPCA